MNPAESDDEGLGDCGTFETPADFDPGMEHDDGNKEYLFDSNPDHLEDMHLAWKSLLNEKLAQCPKESGAKRVLDIGTGNGCWAIEYARNNPQAEVIGVDIDADLLPERCPTNCRLEVADIEEDWPWQGSFDFIFVRNMGGAIKNWARLLSKAYNALESGGWLEFQEHSYSFEDNSKSQGSGAIEEWCELLHRSMSDHGRPMSVGSKMVEMMSNAGISVIKNVVWRVAARPCPPTASARQRHKKGRRCLRYTPYRPIKMTRHHAPIHEATQWSLEDLSLGPFTRYHGLDANEVRLMCMTVRKQLRSEDNDGSWLLRIVCGQKTPASD